jgi:hypothetical protein
MNIDDLKEAWSQDEPGGMSLPISTEALGKTTSAVARIRKNMKSEFIATLVSYCLMVGLIVWLRFLLGPGTQITFFSNIMSILIFTILILNFYFFSRFYLFYKSISGYDISLRDSIRKIAYELELNTEIYRAYNFCMMPLAVLITLAFIGGKDIFDSFMHALASSAFLSVNMLSALAGILISFLVTYYFVNLHIRLTYGKYLAELKRVMDDLATNE